MVWYCFFVSKNGFLVLLGLVVFNGLVVFLVFCWFFVVRKTRFCFLGDFFECSALLFLAFWGICVILGA